MISKRQKIRKILYFVFLIILAFYPLRNIWLGVEMSDSAYSAGNYRFLENVNPMWLFATYLANITGHFITELPGGHMFMGVRFYTALVVSVIAVILYLFFTKVIRIESTLAFFGELLAISLCWCPTTILYNYMTYFFFNIGIIVLYLGLVKEKRWLFFVAGILLGMNVFVRFPNLTEAALILSLWYYGFLQRKRIKDVVQETGICLFGYLTGAGVILLSIAVNYGIKEYTAGIIRLMQMPAEASDYSASAMVLAVALAYKASAKWLIHMLLLSAAGCLVSAFFYRIVRDGNVRKGVSSLGKIMFLGGILVLFRRWHAIGVFNVKYYTYESMFQWVAIFLLLVIFTGIYVLFSKKCTRNEKLLASMVLILIGVTPLGSNNHLYPNMNNMFLVFPFGLAFFIRGLRSFWENGKILIGKAKHKISLFPISAMLAAFLAATVMQCLLFGAVFIFRDGMDGSKRDTKIERNAVLRGMVTNAALAEAIEGLTEYVEMEGLSDKNVISYGGIPGVSYQLDMQPALSTSWPDLLSYNYDVMAEDMETVRECASKGERPLIILGNGPERLIRGEKLDEKEMNYYMLNEKWQMLYEYMLEQGYERTYENGMFFVYQ